MRVARRAAATAALLVTAALPAPAGADQGCTLAAPAPDAQVVAFDLARPMEVALRLTADLPPGAASPGGWHVTTGVAIIERDTHRVLATRAMSAGAAPPSVHAGAADGPALVEDVPAPPVPFRYDHGTSIPVLPRGRYVAVGFVVDGGEQAPFGRWSAQLQGSRPIHCYPSGAAETFELDQRDFSEGVHAGTPAGSAGQGRRLSVDLPRPYSLGVLIAVTAGGFAELTAHGPSGPVGAVRNGIQPFVSGAGRHAVDASWMGAAARVGLAGLTYQLSSPPARWS
jgi:hypothetical protein